MLIFCLVYSILFLDRKGVAAVKIVVEYGAYEETELIIRCKNLDQELQDILHLLKERTVKITAYKDKEIHVLQLFDIYYVEVVDGKNFIYTQDMVLETSHSLNELQETHSNSGLVRIGKSQLVNLYQVSSLKSLPNSRIEITLKNSERLIVSRHYIHYLKEKLGMME